MSVLEMENSPQISRPCRFDCLRRRADVRRSQSHSEFQALKSRAVRTSSPLRVAAGHSSYRLVRGYLDRGKRADAAATVGLVAAPLLVAAGVAVLVIAVRRKSTCQAASPLLGPGLVGVSFVRRF